MLMRVLTLFACLWIWATPAVAQAPLVVRTVTTCGSVSPVYPAGANALATQDINGNVCTAAVVSASVTGFASNGVFGTLTATASSSASTAIPAGATAVRMSNTGTTAVSCTFATGAATAVASNIIIQPSSSVVRVVGSFDHVACIDQTGSASNVVVLEGGSGLGNDSGGGSGSGGGGGAITMASGAVSSGAYASGSVASGAFASGSLAAGAGADGWDVSTGATTATAATAGSTGSVNAKLRLMTSQLDTINTNIQSGTGTFGATYPLTGIAPGLFDGTNLVRPKGDETSGAWVNVKASVSQAVTNAGTFAVQAAQSGTYTVGQTSQYPAGAVIYSASATGTTGATTATLAASGGAATTYICGFSIRANATAAKTGNATVTGTLSGTMNFTQWTAPNASGLGITEMIFAPCYPASAANTAIAVVSDAPSTGGVVSVTAWGYKL